MKITILGTGIYGIAIALELAKKKNNHIILWTENKSLVEEFKNTKKIASIIDTEIPKNIKLTASYEEALDKTKLIFIASASKYVDQICHDIKPIYNNDIPICIATKGFEETTQQLLSEVIDNILFPTNIAVI